MFEASDSAPHNKNFARPPAQPKACSNDGFGVAWGSEWVVGTMIRVRIGVLLVLLSFHYVSPTETWVPEAGRHHLAGV